MKDLYRAVQGRPLFCEICNKGPVVENSVFCDGCIDGVRRAVVMEQERRQKAMAAIANF